MKFGGMYREVQKQDDRFVLSFDREWYQVWKRSQNPFPANEPIYCFTAVFAPVALNTTVYHHWYFRTNSDKPFTHADKIPIKIAGGREGGYRAYTFKQRLDPGDWRVDVETEDGRVVGRVSVVVAEQGEVQPRPERSCTNPMKRISGLKLLEEREGEGTPAKKGDRVVYNTRIFPQQRRRGVRLMHSRQSTSQRDDSSCRRSAHLHRSHHRAWAPRGDGRSRACAHGYESRRLSESTHQSSSGLPRSRHSGSQFSRRGLDL